MKYQALRSYKVLGFQVEFSELTPSQNSVSLFESCYLLSVNKTTRIIQGVAAFINSYHASYSNCSNFKVSHTMGCIEMLRMKLLSVFKIGCKLYVQAYMPLDLVVWFPSNLISFVHLIESWRKIDLVASVFQMPKCGKIQIKPRLTFRK